MIHICYGIYDKDGRYSKFVGTSITSIFENTNRDVTIYLLHDNTLTDENRDKFTYIAGHYNQKIKFYNMEKIAANNIEAIKTQLPEAINSRFTIAALYRLFIPTLLKDLNKTIYLDADILVNRDINDLWSIDLKGKPLAAFPECDSGIKYTSDKYLITANIVNAEDYFNSGVLLLDLEYLRKDRENFGKGYEFIRDSTECKYFDQDILNYCYSQNYIRLPIDFNRYVDVERHLKRPNIARYAIYHYLSDSTRIDMADAWNKLYFTYFVKTPWFDLNSLTNIFNTIDEFYNERQYLLIKMSKLVAGKVRVFYCDSGNRAALKDMFKISENEEIIEAEPIPKSVDNLIKSMKDSPNKKVGFVLVGEKDYNIVKDLLTENNFVEGIDFIDGKTIMPESPVTPFYSNFIVREI